MQWDSCRVSDDSWQGIALGQSGAGRNREEEGGAGRIREEEGGARRGRVGGALLISFNCERSHRVVEKMAAAQWRRCGRGRRGPGVRKGSLGGEGLLPHGKFLRKCL